MSDPPTPIDDFIDRWSKAEASERANAQQFAIELADLLDVPRPSNDHYDGYSFEFPLKIPRGDGTFTQGFIDLYRRGCFVLEAKQFTSQGARGGFSLTSAEKGKTRTKYIRTGMLEEVQRKIERHRKLKELLKELSEVNWALLKAEDPR